MSLIFRKSVRLAPGLRLTLSKRSASVSAGPRGVKASVNTRGEQRASLSWKVVLVEAVGVITVVRGWGDGRTLDVEAEQLNGFHITTYAGGTLGRLPRPTLAAYMSCTAIPDGAEFGHSCGHGPPPPLGPGRVESGR